MCPVPGSETKVVPAFGDQLVEARLLFVVQKAADLRVAAGHVCFHVSAATLDHIVHQLAAPLAVPAMQGVDLLALLGAQSELTLQGAQAVVFFEGWPILFVENAGQLPLRVGVTRSRPGACAKYEDRGHGGVSLDAS
jgi:hypothetical protein